MGRGDGWHTYLFLAAGMAIFGTATPAARVVTQELPVFTAAALRMVGAVVVLLPLVLRDGDRTRPGKSDWLRLALLAFAGVVLFTVFLLYGMREVPAAIGGVVMATAPAATAIGSVLFLSDRLDRWKAAAVGLAVAGVAFLNAGGEAASGGGALWLGVALVFGAVLSEAAYTLIGKRVMERLSHTQAALWSAALALAMLLPPALWQARDLDPASVPPVVWLWLAWWGAGVMGAGSYLWFKGVHVAKGSTASVFMGLMPLSALLTSYLVLGEAFHWSHALGAAGVLAAIGVLSYGERRKEKEGKSSANEE